MWREDIRGDILQVSNNVLIGGEVLFQEAVDVVEHLVMPDVVSPEIKCHWTIAQDVVKSLPFTTELAFGRLTLPQGKV